MSIESARRELVYYRKKRKSGYDSEGEEILTPYDSERLLQSADRKYPNLEIKKKLAHVYSGDIPTTSKRPVQSRSSWDFNFINPYKGRNGDKT